MTTRNNTENDEEVEDADVQAIEEEFWPIAATTTTFTGGANILLAGHRTHAIYFGSRSSSSTSSSDNYNNNNNNNNDTKRINDSKCGGRVLRYKTVCFGHLVAQQIEPLRSYLSCDLPTPITTKHHYHRRRSRYHRRVCELGCGTGGAGISLLLFTNNNNNNNSSAECESKSKFESKSGSKSESKFTSESKSGSVSGSCHVVFTDNDIESLDLCKSNCELNEINPNNYSHRLLGWGLQQQKEQEEKVEVEVEQEEKNDHHRYHLDDIDHDDVNDRSGENSDRNVDSDIKLGEQPHGDSDIVATSTSTSTSTSTTLYNNQAYLDLEKFIQSEAIKVGLSLIETIRPHETLSNEYLFGNDNDNDDDDSMQQITLENMKEAHAVVFIFNRTRTSLLG
ncbi:hypothetical protein FRACYDRAFT_233827 [Fragilariopsis cylindrus CCMP1102]|uniref:Uncharacterized protein n=1 Tax=Fragilariopsis cylindrus CCMP1102 TaxID=635003 RepID=A0A1E7FZU9_9STRA|nr:hypothetical protein FRACYDRAFT_233827 [Fragilariopsis cylindrus CCMP1102]|eukprot:OEU23655.1 hypothetical protein FRACYDRAFT_233827 [Fragilariopsis cylindrus CCMP1102]